MQNIKFYFVGILFALFDVTLLYQYLKGFHMYINNTPQSNRIYEMQNSILNNSEKISNTTIQNQNTTDTVSISNEGLNAKNNWQEISENYDVTNISQREMANMVSNLIDNKLISSTDSLHLMAPRSMNLDPDVKFDLLATTRKSLVFAKESGASMEEIKNKERAIDILETLRNLSNRI